MQAKTVEYRGYAIKFEGTPNGPRWIIYDPDRIRIPGQFTELGTAKAKVDSLAANEVKLIRRVKSDDILPLFARIAPHAARTVDAAQDMSADERHALNVRKLGRRDIDAHPLI